MTLDVESIRKDFPIFETEMREYEQLRATLNPFAFHQAIHDLAIKPVSTPAVPTPKHYDPAG